MTIHEAHRLINNSETNRGALLRCLEDLAKEYGYVQNMPNLNARDAMLAKKTLDEMQLVIEQLKEKLR